MEEAAEIDHQRLRSVIDGVLVAKSTFGSENAREFHPKHSHVNIIQHIDRAY